MTADSDTLAMTEAWDTRVAEDASWTPPQAGFGSHATTSSTRTWTGCDSSACRARPVRNTHLSKRQRTRALESASRISPPTNLRMNWTSLSPTRDSASRRTRTLTGHPPTSRTKGLVARRVPQARPSFLLSPCRLAITCMSTSAYPSNRPTPRVASQRNGTSDIATLRPCASTWTSAAPVQISGGTSRKAMSHPS